MAGNTRRCAPANSSNFLNPWAQFTESPELSTRASLLGEQLHHQLPQGRTRRSVQGGCVPLPHEGEHARVEGRVDLHVHVIDDEAFDVPRADCALSRSPSRTACTKSAEIHGGPSWMVGPGSRRVSSARMRGTLQSSTWVKCGPSASLRMMTERGGEGQILTFRTPMLGLGEMTRITRR